MDVINRLPLSAVVGLVAKGASIPELVFFHRKCHDLYDVAPSGLIESKHRLVVDELDARGLDHASTVQTELDLVSKLSWDSEEQKPYPSEHACRLHPPSGYSQYARNNAAQHHDGKPIDVIYGRKPDGKAEIQALRYPKGSWDAGAARAHCQGRGGSFEAASGKSDEVVKSREIPFILTKEARPRQIVYGVVYEPDEVDTDGDFMKTEDIEEAAHHFMEHHQAIKLQHKGDPVDCPIVESAVAPTEFSLEGQKVKAGTWYMAVKVKDTEMWKAVESGELTGFSFAGPAVRLVEEM